MVKTDVIPFINDKKTNIKNLGNCNSVKEIK